LLPFATALSCWLLRGIKGRTCSAYPACAPEVRLSGGHFADIGIDQAHVDGNLVTAPAWPAHPQWLAKFAELLQ
jgi:protease I